ncbi:rho guanine nucleotide exchange factor 33 isoform 2-T2 [Dama dama]|uniref:rho guanine nucleotide exchange factor 33 isoform X2 n=1 Tax=Cervus canadensis TaxID=1574408 RepID=UPI001C9E96CC|nr:rho guanine nucleotide exchange factor 33 isoform X2 [Cervus canadensis]XP_043324321.1 rho guanine nucleotide exchange factor 33 isoform X2 [Cervus canadensis]XP_043324322.1 rho guanine nucleotide exchange factor 33 isoform X2 [Cervus canadensis]XP_043324323.1 rho guanine nucleotide exchange factor 33 isoform X2 [Cervus canadensis]XP_043774125.1 rho guanine nucleotide exchange factor 33 isoform X2 [Cervus elaphus]XP_043774126.1 rho guanine nucleotide exchange factor 33 isoform X2 [Cervus el
MEKTKTKQGDNEHKPMNNPSAQIYQLQALASELKTGFTEAMQELSRIQHGEYALEEKVKSCRCSMEEKVTEMKNSLNYFKEELSNAMSMIQAITSKQEEMQQKIEQLQQEKRRESRKVKAKKTQKEEHGSQAGPAQAQGSPFRSINIPEPVLPSEDFTNLLPSQAYEKAQETRSMHVGDSNVKGIMGSGMTPTPEAEENLKPCLSADIQPKSHLPPGVWRQPKDTKDWGEEYVTKDHPDKLKEVGQGRHSSLENVLCETSLAAKRQTVALELLESERKYVINISLILKIKATFQGSDGKRNSKERSLFPGSLRYIVQQHLDLLHALQERVLKWPRQGVLGDLFLKLTNDENNFLDYYVAYLRDLPECISLVHVVVLKEGDEEIKSDIYTLFFHIVQRIPEYLIHLQNVLKFTEQEHPDYYLLLVCVQRLRVFISHYTLLFQCNEDLLIQKRKKLKKSSMAKLYKGLASQCANAGQDASPTAGPEAVRDSGIHSEEMLQPYPSAPSSGPAVTHLMPPVKKSQQQQSLMESMQPGKPSDWEMEGRKHERPESLLAPAQFCAAEQDVKALAGPLQAIPEMDFEPSPAEQLGNVERSLRAPAELLPDARSYVPAAYEEFEYGGEIFALPAPYDEEPFQAPALFENCSPASSESSLDICFLRPVSFAMEAERPEHPLQPLPKSATSPAGSSGAYKLEAAAQAHKAKPLSRSLKEFPRAPPPEGVAPRLYSTRSSSGGRAPLKAERAAQAHGPAASARGAPRTFFPQQRSQSEKQTYLEVRREMHLEDATRFCPKEERESEQTSFSDQNPRQDQKGGFRSSFRKLFKKKNGNSTGEDFCGPWGWW